MKKKYDVVALGELLIDFTMNGKSEQGNPMFEANPGGAPCNVLALLGKMGKSCAFIGKVGNDMFGKQLKDTVEEAGIDTEGLLMDQHYNTTLAFVKTFENGDRDFSFYRQPGADMMLTADEVREDLIASAKIFHFGSLSMTHEGVREATRKAVAYAKEKGLTISFDPNYREPLWKSLKEAKEQMAFGLSVCDILKISDNEIELMTGESDFDKAAAILREKYPNIKLLNVTAGAGGSYSYYKDKRVFVPIYSGQGIIETTGAGDTFGGSVLNYVLEKGLDNLTEENLKEMLRFSNTAAYLVATKKGAIRSMPEREQVEELLKKKAD